MRKRWQIARAILEEAAAAVGLDIPSLNALVTEKAELAGALAQVDEVQ